MSWRSVFLMVLLLSAIPAEAAQGCLVSATVVEAGGQPAAGARLAVLSLTGGTPEPSEPLFAEADASGRAKLRLAPGLYKWVVTSPEHPTTLPTTFELGADCGVSELGRIVLSIGETISGRVVNQAGKAVAEAAVLVGDDPGTPGDFRVVERVRTQSHRQAVTNQDGKFELHGLTPKVDYHVSVNRPGFRPAWQNLKSGGPAARFQLELAAGLVVGVVDTQNEPVAGARVELERLGAANTAGGIFLLQATDAAGRFEQASLEVGETAIQIIAIGYGKARRVVNLQPGEGLHERFVLTPIPSAPVEVVVVEEDGKTVSEASVSLRSVPSGEDGTYVHDRSDEEGSVKWATVPLGDYELTVQVPTGVVAKRPPSRRLTVEESGVALTVVFERPPGRAVAGRVMDSSGVGREGVTLHVFAGTSISLRTGADGRFRFGHLPYGEHEIYLEVPGVAGVPAEMRRVGEQPEPWGFHLPDAAPVVGRLLLPPGVEVAGTWSLSAQRGDDAMLVSGWVEADQAFRFPALVAGSWKLTAVNDRAVGSIEVEVSGAESTIRRDLALEAPTPGFAVGGTLLHRGEPLTGARVHLRPTAAWQAGTASTHLTAVTDLDGSFDLENVPAGSYHLTVSWGGALVLNREVSVDGRLDLSRQLRFGHLRGRVVAPGIDPTKLTVRLHPRGPVDESEQWLVMTHSYLEWVRPRPDGTFEVGPLEEGRWSFQVDLEGHAPVEREVLIAGEDIEDFVLALEPSPGLAFRVTTASGTSPASFSANFSQPGKERPLHRYFDRGSPPYKWDTLPPGQGTLTIKSPYARSRPVPVTIPGPEVELRLPARGAIEIHAPLLTEAEGQQAQLTIRPLLEGDNRCCRSRPVHRYPTAQTVPPGHYEVRLDAADGRSWTASVTVIDHETSTIVLGGE